MWQIETCRLPAHSSFHMNAHAGISTDRDEAGPGGFSFLAKMSVGRRERCDRRPLSRYPAEIVRRGAVCPR